MPTVTSKDGTTIGYDTRGAGPALILVDGATGFRSQGYSNELADLVASDFTVYSYDRRGRGESGNTLPFAVEREIEDIGALVDAAGGAAYVYGISSGGALALEAAIGLQSKVKKLALYEIPYDSTEQGIAAWHTYRAKLGELLAAGQRGDAIALFMSFVGVPEDMLAGMRQSPMWAPLESVAPTLAYDAAALGADRVPPTERAATVTAQTLVMDGGASLEYMPFMRASAEALAKAIPNAQHQVVEGQTHNVDAKVLAPIMAAFLKR
jgi:pimeloyl-ACP methyl ester carboxylesterase